MNEPITRSEMYLAALGGEAVTPPEPITRMDMYLAYLNGMTDTYPEPITRTEQYLYKLCQNGMGGGGGVTIRNQNKTITANGSYKADSGYTGLGTVTVNVPQEDPVLQDKTVTENGTVTADPGYDGLGKVTVNVEASGGGDDTLMLGILDRSIKTFNNNSVQELGYRSMSGSKMLENVILPNATKFGEYAFLECSNLVYVSAPKLTEIGINCFMACTSLTKLDAPSLLELPTKAFDNCSSLKELEFYGNNIKTQCFNACAIKALFLRKMDGVTTLESNKAFASTAFSSAGVGGVFFVPSFLEAAYSEETNWTMLMSYTNNRTLHIEDYTVDGTVTGEIDWDKVNALFE